MSASLDPIVVSKMRDFSRRRRRLLATRGIAAGLVTTILGTSVASFADWLWLLSDQVRWSMSLAVYFSVMLVVWWTSLRLLVKPVDRRELAGRMEDLQPELREQLLSAVELATDDLKGVHDSPVFRSLLQNGVAQLMVPVRIRRLLPLKLIAYWLVTAVVVGTLAIALISGPDQRFRQLATRALLPGANIARISRIQVEIIEPQPPTQVVPENETVAVRVKTTGGQVQTAQLEMVTVSKGTVTQRMAMVSDNEFVANIDVADEDLEYRILAGDAVTEYFYIDSVPRPRVASFRKNFRYPDYAGLPAEQTSESHGDLVALEGTRVRLELELNQPVVEAELRLESTRSGDLNQVALEQDPEDLRIMFADLEVIESAIYKVHLVSKETGFANSYSPTYEIRPVADLIPRVGFVDQQATTLLLPPNDLLALEGMGEDDLPLVTLEQQISINGEEWNSIELDFETVDEGQGRQIRAAWHWDLEPLGLETGDQVLTKLVAVDRKGHRGESVPIRVVIAASDYDPDRHDVMELKLSLVDGLREFVDQVEEQNKPALVVLTRLLDEESTGPLTDTETATFKDQVLKQREAAETLWRTVLELQSQMPVGADSQDLELVGRVVSRLARDRTVAPLHLIWQLESLEDTASRREVLESLRTNFERTSDDAKNLFGHYQQLATFNFLRALAQDADSLRRQQEFVVGSPTQTWQRLVRQESVVLQQLEALESLIQKHLARLPDSTVGHLNRLLVWSDGQRLQLQSAMESEDQLSKLRSLSRTLMSEINAKQKLESLEVSLQTRMKGARKDLENRSGRLYSDIRDAGALVTEQFSLISQSSKAEDSATSRKWIEQSKQMGVRLNLSLKTRLRRLDDAQDLTEARSDADVQFAADLGLTRRAVQHLLNQLDPTELEQGQQIGQNLFKIAAAYQTLEGGHEFALASAATGALLKRERWDHESLDAHIDHPRQWDLVQQLLETASVGLRRARAPELVTRGVDQTRWSQPVRDAGRKINERRWNRNLMVGAGHELLELQTQLAEVQKDLDPVLEEARSIIQEFAPTIAEMARQTAEDIRELESTTTRMADELESEQDSETLQVETLETEQAQVNEQIEDLFEALIEDANQQDLRVKEEREQAVDADAAIATVQPPAIEMNRALQRAIEEQEPKTQAQELSEAAERQEQTAQALEKVAEHFERLAEGADVSETREALRKAFENEPPSEAQQQALNEAKELSEMLDQPVEDLIRDLEEELQRNPAMREALSEIAKNTLEDSQDRLEFASRDEENLQKGNERADQVFQQKKTDLVNELKELGKQATDLSNTLANRAQQEAQQGKTPDAVETLQEARQQLQQATASANRANDNQTLRDLSELTEQTRGALVEATETLRAAEKQTEQGKNEEVHADAQSRDTAQNEAEKRNQDFVKQQTGALQNEAKRTAQAKQQADKRVSQAEQRVAQAENELESARTQADAAPENQGAQQARANAESNLDDQKGLLEQSKQQQAMADQRAREAQANLEQLKNQSPPKLDAANPETQLADRYTEDAIRQAEQLNVRADQLADSSGFEETLETPKTRLAASQQEQQGVAEDVQQIADDLARAARHERRLNNESAAEAVQQASDQVQQVVDQPIRQAEERLTGAVEQAEQNRSVEGRSEAVAPAQKALGESQDALTEQADQLGQTTESLLEQGELDGNAASEENAGGANNELQNAGEEGSGEEGSGETNSNNSDSGNSSSEGAPEEPQSGSQSGSQSESQTGGEAQTPSESARSGDSSAGFTPQEAQLGRQLARALDELDRLQAANEEASSAEAATGESGSEPIPLASLQQALQQSRSTLAASRSARQQAAMQAMNEGNGDPEGIPPDTGAQPDFDLRSVNRNEGREWGKLRARSADNLSRGGQEAVSAEYRMSVEAYFKVLAERASEKK